MKTRETFGEWEGEFMIYERSQDTMNVASLVEHKPRFPALFCNNDRSSMHFINKLMDVMEPLPQSACQSISCDRGFELRAWRKLKSGTDTESWFCDPQAPWQKGSVANLNKCARRYLPRGTQITALSPLVICYANDCRTANRNMKASCDSLNGTLRKCLGWRTPTGAFREEMMKVR